LKKLTIYKNLFNCSTANEVFNYFSKTLNDSITYWDYFVNWDKVFGNLQNLEVELNTLNYLIGKDNIEKEFKMLLTRQHSIARLIPLLLACRESDFKILTDFTGGNLKYENISFNFNAPLSNQDIEKVCRFAYKTNLLELFKTRKIKSIPDYVLGVEVGLDSNGRKNRGGTAMEKIVESLLAPICTKNKLLYMKQATSEKVLEQWGIKLKVDKSNRRFDFAVKRDNKLYLIETNYYSGGGSKLKATAGEYKSLYDFITTQGHSFIWLTDGLGWRSTLRPLEETFNHIDYTLNLQMVITGILDSILNQQT